MKFGSEKKECGVPISDIHKTFFHSGNQSVRHNIMVVYRGPSVSLSRPGHRHRGETDENRAPAATRDAKFFNSGPYIPVDQIPTEIKRFFLKTKVCIVNVVCSERFN